jgi:hypothetical protein
MGKERRRTRIATSLDELPEEIRLQVDVKLVKTKTSYKAISDWLKGQGYDISKSAVGRYALRINEVSQRLVEAQRQTEVLINAVKMNPDVDYTDAGNMLLADGLVKRLAMAEEEFDNLPLDKAGRLMTALSRTKTYKDRVRQDMKKRVELAFEGMEAEMMSAIKSDPTLAKELRALLQRAKEKMINDD